MTMDTAKVLLKGQGWSAIIRTRYNSKYLYAIRRVGKAIQEIYIAPLSRLERMTDEDVLRKLRKTV
jgi:hypothetical protein